MSKGRYLKAAERACARKARFETAFAAESFANFRFRAYLCPVCHHYHLTSRSGAPAAEPPETPKPKESGPKLGDLNWEAALNPQAKKEPKPLPNPNPPRPAPVEAKCTGPVRKDGKVMLSFRGRLVKSAKVPPLVADKLGEGVVVEVTDEQAPRVIRLKKID